MLCGSSRFIEEAARKAVQSRRHGQVCYSALDTEIPLEDWVRFEFEPANPWTATAQRYSGRLAI